MEKKVGRKKIKHEKQRHDPDDDINPRNTSSSRNNMDPNDFISHLPDDILHHIISLLPFKSAVRTSFLSTHWKHLWKEALLDSVHDVITIEAAITAITSFVDDFDTRHRPRNKWGLIFELGHGRGSLVASISSNSSLKLDFSAGKQEFPMPFDLFLKLNLAPPNRLSRRYMFDWLLEENHPSQREQPPSNTMRVKSLHLISVSHLSNMAVSSLVPKLPFLRSLTIAKCNGLQSLQIKEAKGLRKLVVLDCPHLQSLSFEGSSLKSFRYRGNLVSFRFRGKCNCFPLIRFCECGLLLDDAMIDIRQGALTQWTWDFEIETPFSRGLRKGNHCDCANKYKCFNSILRSIKDVQSLTMCRWFYETTMCRKLPFSSRCPEYYLSVLELWWIDCSMERESINALLCFLKLCPNLKRLNITLDPKCYNLPSTGKFSTSVIVPDKLDDLKVVKIEGFANEEKENFMARRLIPLFGEKNPVIISKPNGKCLKHLVKMAKLEKKGKYPYKFEMVENVDENFPDHVHINI
ncbi:F-box protein At2g39490 isoform X3 [Gossypium raimondii]|uniref:F-box protein At2g39490 isoform X3 n=1 Tax=Gossypium raimondii TaxID=29730 RepID=UPI00063ADC08|nr:F-box protein At2g39490 isoform X3 [Gossypium raimondii]